MELGEEQQHKSNLDKSKDEFRKPITIFSTKKGVDVVKSPVKSKILEALREKDLSFDEIVKLAGKSKSTVSAHLKSLTDKGIIDSRPHPQDQRKKIFYLTSRYLGKMTPQEIKEKEEEKVEFLVENLIDQGNPFEFFRLMFHTLRVEMIQEGINLDPVLHKVGIRIGEVFYPQLRDEETKIFLENIARFWEANELGRLEVESIDPLVIRAYDCFECGFLPNIGKSACALDSGILESLFSVHFSQKVDVNEVKCYARGDKYCCFVIGHHGELVEE